MTARDQHFPYPPLVAIGNEGKRAEADEAELARLLKVRNRVAWEGFFERHFDTVYRYALVRLSSPQAAEDVASATFQRALATVERYSYRGRPVLAWLYGIARNLVKETQRSDGRRGNPLVEGFRPGINGNHASDYLTHPDGDTTEMLVSRIDLHGAMRRLTRIQREVLILRYYAGLSAAETGQVTGRSLEAVYSLQARALLALRRHLV